MPHRDIHLDFNFAMSDLIGSEGISIEEINRLKPLAKEIYQGIHAMKEMGQLPFFHLLHDDDSTAQILKTSKKLRKKFDTLVVFGIGGSALGAKTLIQAIKGSYYNYFSEKRRASDPRVFIFDTIDPDSFSDFLSLLNLKKTIFNIVSKSGETLETMAQFFIVFDLLKRKLGSKWKDHLVITTDPSPGLLRKFSDENQLFSFSIPSGVGGRFSVFSSAALFPAAMAGIDIEDLLAGARRAEVRSMVEDLWLNPAFFLAALQFLMDQKGKRNLVLMPYSDRLSSFSEWYAQLWSESIGKRFSLKGEKIQVGSAPIIASGPKDQHSQLQLYMEGPKDKYILFFRFENFENSIQLSVPKKSSFEKKLSYLNQKTLESILTAESFATATALAEEGCPSSSFSIPYCNAYCLGQLLFLLQMTTVFAGGLYNVNPFDQPGVELGKKLTHEFLQKENLEATSPMMWRKLEKKFIL